jgi:hypothetical protein
MQTIQEFVNNHPGIGYSVTCIDQRPDVSPNDDWHFPKNPNNKPFDYEFCITFKGREYRGYYSKGIGHGKETAKIKGNTIRENKKRAEVRAKDHKNAAPTLFEVLDSLALDISDIFYGGTFEEWAEGLGYDADSRQAEKIYNQCRAAFHSLLALFGMERLRELVEDTERE